jgi:p-hydroxybenzoate 3-monooxygenase
MRTQVAIVGAGPAGLMLSHLLHLQGIESVVLEARSRAAIEATVRAGVIEQSTVDLMAATGVAERLLKEGYPHHGIYLRFDGHNHFINAYELMGGKTVTIYPQHEVIKDLVAARLAARGDLRFEVSEVRVGDFDTGRPWVTFRHEGRAVRLDCDFIAGCDGSQGICRPSIPTGAHTIYEKVYPFSWFGILAEAPTAGKLIYSYHEKGFALVSSRTPTLQRMYFQVDPHDNVANWPDERIWAEFYARLEGADGWTFESGKIIKKDIIGMHSYVSEPMQYGRMFLAGDAAHIVPPTGAKGLNLAIADVKHLADGLKHFYATGQTGELDAYSSKCLRRVWRAEHFSWWMTSMLHRFPDGDKFQQQLQLSQLRYVVSSHAASYSLAENYVGFEG